MTNEPVKIKVKEDRDWEKESGAAEILEWQMEEPNFSPKSDEWYWALSIFGLAIVVFSIILKNYLFIIIVALAALIIYSSKNKKLELLDFRLDGEGLCIGSKIYLYDNFESFWIFSDHAELAFHYKRHFTPLLTIPFRNSDELQIRKILLRYLPENEEEQSLVDLLRKRFF